MSAFSLLVKPVSWDCNLDCKYCYYGRSCRTQSFGGKRPRPVRMSREILGRMIRSYMASRQEIHAMIWHGGEPSLLPCSFYETAIRDQKKYAKKGTRISNSFQTNAVGISRELARFMARYRFLCGVSVDGPARIHDTFRRTRDNAPTLDLVLKGMARLAGAGVAMNALTLVTQANVRHPENVYEYLKSIGFSYLQFIPCVETHAGGNPAPFAICGEEWGQFLIRLFNIWYKKDVHTVSVRLFETILARMVYNTAIDCQAAGACNRYLVVESNGDVYPCDFFVRPEHKLGNVMETDLQTMATGADYHLFAKGKKQWHKACDNCEFLRFCMADCRKFRLHGDDGLSVLCSGWKKFYAATLDRFEILAATIRNLKNRCSGNDGV